MTRVMITQPRYLPNMEHLIRMSNVDLVVLLDQTVINTRDYENRTKLRCNGVDKWLTIPVTKGKSIAETEITGEFKQDHKNKIKQYYGKEFAFYDWLCEYEGPSYAQFMVEHYKAMVKYLGKDIKIVKRSDLTSNPVTGKEEIKEILQICKATEYLTGSNCLNYGVTPEYLQEIGVELKMITFTHEVEKYKHMCNMDIRYSIIDSLMK
jgi:hypothetical protein